MPTLLTPCFTGNCVCAFHKQNESVGWINRLKLVFDSGQLAEKHQVVDAPSVINRTELISFIETCATDDVQDLFKKTNFHHHTAKASNPDGAKPTQTNYTVIVTVREATSRECGAQYLGLLFKFSILIKEED